MSPRITALPFRLPELGPIGSNGLANPRDFETPVAWFEDSDEPTEVVQKSLGSLWTTTLDHSPLDVVAWHGNLRAVALRSVALQHDRQRSASTIPIRRSSPC